MAEEDGVEMLPTTTTTTAGGPDEDDYGNEEGDQPTTTTQKTPAMALEEDSDKESESEREDDAMTKFLDGDRPTSAGEPSHNVPKKVVINMWCVSTSIILLILCVSIIFTACAPILFQTMLQNMLHYMVDTNRHNTGQGGFDIANLFMMFFCIFNTAVFAMCGNLDYLLMVACGYLYGDATHEWLTGATVYLISNYLGCCTAFMIGRALFKDKLYFIFSKHEKYRYFQRVFTDHSFLLSMTFNLNVFLPSGLIAYGLSISDMTWKRFLIGQACRIPNIAIMCYAGYVIRRYSDHDPIENTNIDDINIEYAYTSNPYTYALTITFCVIFALLLLVTSFAMYLQFQRLVLGDALKKAEEEESESPDNSNDSVYDSNEDPLLDEQVKEEDSTSSSESQDTLDEYGFPNEHKKEKFLFQDDYAPDQTDPEIDDVGIKTETDTGGADIEMPMIAKPPKKAKKQKRSKHKLDSDRNLNKKKKSKKKKKKNAIWQTIVLATSPSMEDTGMLFEEGPRFKSNSNANYMGKQQRNANGSIVVTMPNMDGNGSGNKDKKSDKNGKAKSPRSPKTKIDFGKFGFGKKGNEKTKSEDASSLKGNAAS